MSSCSEQLPTKQDQRALRQYNKTQENLKLIKGQNSAQGRNNEAVYQQANSLMFGPRKRPLTNLSDHRSPTLLIKHTQDERTQPNNTRVTQNALKSTHARTMRRVTPEPAAQL